MTGNVRSLASASFGVFKPLPANAPESKLRELLKEERALRQAAVKALSQDDEEDQKTADRLAELEIALATAERERASALKSLEGAQAGLAQSAKQLEREIERGRNLETAKHEEATLRAQAEAFYTASASTLDDANKQLGLLRTQLLESEQRVTSLTRELRRPTTPAAPVPYFLDIVQRDGPGGDLRRLRLSPDLTPPSKG